MLVTRRWPFRPELEGTQTEKVMEGQKGRCKEEEKGELCEVESEGKKHTHTRACLWLHHVACLAAAVREV